MKLTSQTFRYLSDLEKFVNENGIKKENILGVVPSASYSYTLIFWR